jgi:chorismate synthase
VAAGALAKQLLAAFDITVFGFVAEVGGERSNRSPARWKSSGPFATK